LFIDICDIVIIGGGDGKIEIRDINAGKVTHDQIDFLEDENIFKDLD
jgi:ribose 5-phosphate isomerase A